MDSQNGPQKDQEIALKSDLGSPGPPRDAKGHSGMTPPARLVGSIRFRVVSGVVGFVPCELRKRRPERSKNEGRAGQKPCSNCSRKLLRRLWGRPGAPRGLALNCPVACWSIFWPPRGLGAEGTLPKFVLGGPEGPKGGLGRVLGRSFRAGGPQGVPGSLRELFW